MSAFWSKFLAFLGFVGLLSCEVQDDQTDLLVAFHCGRPAMHLTDSGWTIDNTTDCLTNSDDFLNYCKKVYPTLDIRNFVDLDRQVIIKNWCDFLGENCDQSFKVQPLQCLVGPFVAKDLFVPDRCMHDRVFDSRVCSTLAGWKITADGSCKERGLSLERLSALQPCDLGQFSGVQFVCCPSSEVPVELVNNWPAVVSVPNSTTDRPGRHKEPESEHRRYLKEKAELQKQHSQEIAKIMDAWDEAHHQVDRMRIRDPEMAEKLETKMRARFKKTLSSLEEKEEAEKRQINSFHDRNVEWELNKRKREAMEVYMAVLANRKQATLGDVLQVLKHYIRVEQKDRMHVINHYQHLRTTYPSAAETSRELVAEHLRTIQLRINRALEMLNRVPAFKDEIKRKIEEVLDEYKGFDELEAAILRRNSPNEDTLLAQNKGSAHHLVEKKEDEGATDVANKMPASREGNMNVADSVQGVSSRIDEGKTVVPAETEKPENNTMEVGGVENIKENSQSEDVVEIQPLDHPSHLGTSELRLKEKQVLTKKPSKSSAVGPLVLVLTASVFLVTISILGIVVWRQYVEARRLRNKMKNGSCLLASPERVHVSNMQVNGYENPTYKYFEAKTTI